jgi:hypothetical protein
VNTDSENLSSEEKAMADRLARLSSMPVDTTQLAARLRRQIPSDQATDKRGTIHDKRSSLIAHRSSSSWRRRLSIAAAILIVLGGSSLLLFLFALSGPALASPGLLAQVHDDMVAGNAHGIRKVSSVDAAAAALAEEWPRRPALPDMPDMPDHRVMSCCVHEVGRKKMACLSLMVNDTPITLAIADSADIRTPDGEVLVRDGVTYRVQSAQGVNMAMTQRHGRWMCLMGRLPLDQLVEIASKLRL